MVNTSEDELRRGFNVKTYYTPDLEKMLRALMIAYGLTNREITHLLSEPPSHNANLAVKEVDRRSVH
jgi:hypothetical protein